jgi:signal transduction histidine kinase
MDSPRDLAVSYFLGTGLGLATCLIGYFLLADGATTIRSVGTFTALGFSGSLPYVGYWLKDSELSDSAVWAVAQWCAFGIGVATLVVVGAVVAGAGPWLQLEFPHLLVNLIALGGVLGALVGLIRQLRRKHERVRQLNRRNTVLNRVLRHNVRNDVNVIDGYVDVIEDTLDEDDAGLIEPIRRKTSEIVEMSTAARHIESIGTMDEDRPVDVVRYVEVQIDTLEETHPDAEITAELPPEAWADVGGLVRTVVDNVLENAVEHNDRLPRIHVAVSRTEEAVTIDVADNGPGIPEQELEAVTAGPNGPTTHGSGLGLWLVRWFVEHYGGELSFERQQPRGTVVSLSLPAATRQPATVDAVDATDTGPV